MFCCFQQNVCLLFQKQIWGAGGAGEDRQSALWSPMSEEVVLQALQQILDVTSSLLYYSQA